MKPKFFQLAKIASQKSKSPTQMGCVIVKKNKVISFGYNDMTKTHPKCPTFGNFLHAEIHAMIGTHSDDLQGASIYVYREFKRSKNPAMAKPCSVCSKIIEASGIKICYYTTDKGYDIWQVR